MNDYNGWSNYETWNVNLWLNNEELFYREFLKCKSAKQLSEYVYDRFNSSGAFGDLIEEKQLANVDFNEIMYFNSAQD